MIPVKHAQLNITKRPAFGNSEERFMKFFIHPGLDRQGLFQPKSRGCDPCLYHPKSMKDAFEINKNRKMSMVPWEYKKALEEWAKNLGYRNQKILAYKAQRRAALGPAWHEIPEPQKVSTVRMNTGFSTVKRFKRFPSKTPGPGRYYTEHPFKALPGPHTAEPSFDWSPACRFPDTETKWAKAPNRYRIVDKESIEEKPKKLVSRRGPYDLFTGLRNYSTIRSNLCSNSKSSAATWPLALPGCLERFKKNRLGVFNKTGRAQRPSGRNVLVDTAMCYKNPEEPGPGAHDLDPPREFRQFAHGFNSSGSRAARGVGVWPAVGRYSWVKPHPVSGNGHKHVFLCKVPRTIGSVLPQPMNSF